MPLYEYQCLACGQEFEQIVRFSEAHMAPSCPACQGKNTRKKISIVASHGSANASAGTAGSSNCAPRGGFS